MKMRRGIVAIGGACLVFSFGAVAPAALITFNGATTDETGTGFGNVLSVLTLLDDRPGADDLEAGSVVWNGSQDVFGTVGGGIDTKAQQSQTRTVAELIAAGINATNLGVVLNLNETGSNPAVNLNDFYVRFQSPSGATLFDAPFDADNPANAPTNALVPIGGGGTGTSGYLFPITLTAAEATQLFSNPQNRVGLYINAADAISGVDGGAEVFYLAAIPEPAAMVWGALALALSMRRRS